MWWRRASLSRTVLFTLGCGQVGPGREGQASDRLADVDPDEPALPLHPALIHVTYVVTYLDIGVVVPWSQSSVDTKHGATLRDLPGVQLRDGGSEAGSIG
jgi:hypothetical protein